MGFVSAHRAMANEKLRRQIAFEAARLMYVRQESEYYPGQAEGGPADLPRLGQAGRSAQQSRNPRPDPAPSPGCTKGNGRTDNLREMRVEALRMMRILRAFRPRLIGSTLTGHVRHGSDIDLHVFSDTTRGGHFGARRRRRSVTTSSASGSASTARSASSRTCTSATAFRSS